MRQVSDFPADYPPFTADHHDLNPSGSKWVPDDILNHGGTCVVGPLGTFIVEPVWDKEEIVYATLNLPDLAEARVCYMVVSKPKVSADFVIQMDFDPVGSYSRPDVL